MSSPPSGESAIFLHHIYRPKFRNPPFLRRNVRKVLRSLSSMGGTISSLRDSLGLAEQDDDEDARPPKRRRINKYDPPPDPFSAQNHSGPQNRKPSSHVTYESASRPLKALEPSSFYGDFHQEASVGRAETPLESSISGKYISKILPVTPVDFERSLHIDLDGICPLPTGKEYPETIRRQMQSVNIRCDCTVAIFYAKDKDDPEQGQYSETCRSVKRCTLRVTIGVDSEMKSEFQHLEPFVFSQQEFYVNRKSRASGKIQYTSGLADDYHVQVSIRPVGFQKAWPPVRVPVLADLKDDSLALQLGVVSKSLEEGRAVNNDLSLSCVTDNLLNPKLQNQATKLALCHGGLEQPLDYVLNLKIQWALPNPRIVRSTYPSTSNTATDSLLSAPRRPDETPISNSSRSPRHRPNVATYNLKTLSAQAQGRSPRAPRRKDVGSRFSNIDGTTVTYSFGRADAAEAGVKQQTTVPGLNCPFCNCRHRSVSHLRLHLRNEHEAFKFSVRRVDPPRVAFFVEILPAKSRPALTREVQRTFQLGKTLTLFDLESYLSGDNSWIKTRRGMQHNLLPGHIAQEDDNSSSSSSLHESRYSSPNTSLHTDEPGELCKANSPAKLPIRPHRVVYVPATTKPLYHTVTKQLLKPGHELPSSDDEKDEDWLHQKHRDGINDFTDLADHEKEYINQWNPFTMKEQHNCPRYLPDAMLRFVEANKTWLGEKSSRRREFILQCSVFIMRGVITQADFSACIEILRQAHNTQMDVDPATNAGEKGNPVRPAKLRGPLSCACGGLTELVDRVACRGNLKNVGISLYGNCRSLLDRLLT
ncbi:uncharacterized protein BP5553_08345 [Venustampulla echinocandica]|uniref:Polycomb protein VEFS-Box domain-containing protein n=1 Tax=Venustampulla echinocandica TaxID=2656787 RepID=A0A370TGF0_9HELO|nr:uncharacterized protein BP5553_08345 [Venustampulla echinocandica]RDL33977.1 hypothetical protein BP5553_08345 [Venustampulla echinocandica]